MAVRCCSCLRSCRRILALSDRVLVMYEGRLVHETRPANTNERTLGLHMTGRGVQPLGPS